MVPYLYLRPSQNTIIERPGIIYYPDYELKILGCAKWTL